MTKQPSQTEESARIVLTAERLYSSEIRMNPRAVPSPLTVPGIRITHSSSSSKSSWKMCDRIAFRNVSFTIAQKAFIYGYPECR